MWRGIGGACITLLNCPLARVYNYRSTTAQGEIPGRHSTHSNLPPPSYTHVLLHTTHTPYTLYCSIHSNLPPPSYTHVLLYTTHPLYTLYSKLQYIFQTSSTLLHTYYFCTVQCTHNPHPPPPPHSTILYTAAYTHLTPLLTLQQSTLVNSFQL